MKNNFESQESSSPIITRAVANGLLGININAYSFSLIQEMALRVISLLRKEVAEYLIPRLNSSTRVRQFELESIKTKDLVNCRLSDYQRNSKKFPAISIGVGMGGATAHLALGLGGPFLPQTFVLTLKNGTRTGNVQEYFEISKKIAKTITDNNTDLISIQHYDPVHDGWLVKRVNHLRLKLTKFPEEYREFIQNKLIEGGEIIYLEGTAKWKQYRVGERNLFQVGGWGDISADEFINGSKRLTEFSKKERLKYSHWNLEGYPIIDGYESEWGSEPGLGEEIEKFCREQGYKFTKISMADPNGFSRLAFNEKLARLTTDNINPSGVIIEMFSQFDAFCVENSALVPLWLIFNTRDSQKFLEEMTCFFPEGVPVFFSPLSTFTNTPDLVQYKEWEFSLKDFKVVNIGARKSHYPGDALALLDWKKPLINWWKENRCVIHTKATGDLLQRVIAKDRQS
ncbi:MAG: hypothetical protein NTZ74_06630 [Chloroflexi bacterium]|nr:hypothetical protein [Chloroflexota bacterium]